MCLLGISLSVSAQVLVAPGESTETAFRREVRGPWFAWLTAQEEGNTRLATAKIEEIQKHAQKIGIRRMTDLAISATLLGRREMHTGKLELARGSFETAVKMDPDLPEAYWAQLSLAFKARRFGDAPGRFFGAIRATFADAESRRTVSARVVLLVFLTLATIGAMLVFITVLGSSRRYFHDLAELVAQYRPGLLAPYLAVLLFLWPLLLGFDVIWLGLALFAAIYGYATTPQRIAAGIGLMLVIPLFPVLDRQGYELVLSSSPILRGAEMLKAARYDQRVLDDLEGVKTILPEDTDVRFLLGRLYQMLGQNDRAVTEYTTAIQSAPSESRCLVNRGNIRFVDGDFGSALEDYLEAIKRQGNNVHARFNLSLVYAETFRTQESEQARREAEAISASLVASFQRNPTLVKVVSMDFSPEEARKKVDALQRSNDLDGNGRPKSQRLMGQYRRYRLADGLFFPLVPGCLLSLAAGFGLIQLRQKRGKGYAIECQKCGRTFCRRCKPSGDNPLLCSQCVHVYMKKDGVAIETKLQKVEEVKRRKTLEDRGRLLINAFIPGAAAFLQDRIVHALVPMALFVFGLWAAFGREALAIFMRPAASPALAGTVMWCLVAFTGWILGQTWSRRS